MVVVVNSSNRRFHISSTVDMTLLSLSQAGVTIAENRNVIMIRQSRGRRHSPVEDRARVGEVFRCMDGASKKSSFTP